MGPILPLLLWLALLLVGIAVTGCKSNPLSRYVSPRVTGRVVDSETRKPISNVQVRRLSTDDAYRTLQPPKGGEVLQQPPAALTGNDGRFDLESVRALTPFGKGGWYSVTLRFEHSDYGRFSVTYTLVNATNSATGEPVVDAGDVLMIPRAK